MSRSDTLLSRPLLAAWVILACGCEEPSPSPPPPPPGTKTSETAAVRSAAKTLQGTTYEVVEVESPGKLAATVTYSGDPLPVPTKVPVNINVETCGGKVFTENLLVDGETRGLKNAVIRLEGIERGKAPPEIVTVSNKHCAFVPHVAVAMKGTKLQLRNEDPVLHTTHPYINGANFFNKPLAAGAEPTRPRPIPRTGLMDIRCDVHKWMQAYIVIHSNPYLAVTDEKGKLIIDGIPAGKYTYTAWHEQLEESKGEVEIAAGQTAELVVTLDPPAEQ